MSLLTAVLIVLWGWHIYVNTHTNTYIYLERPERSWLNKYCSSVLKTILIKQKITNSDVSLYHLKQLFTSNKNRYFLAFTSILLWKTDCNLKTMKGTCHKHPFWSWPQHTSHHVMFPEERNETWVGSENWVERDADADKFISSQVT